MGFEPTNNSFADCPLKPLGYACIKVAGEEGIEPISGGFGDHPTTGVFLPYNFFYTIDTSFFLPGLNLSLLSGCAFSISQYSLSGITTLSSGIVVSPYVSKSIGLFLILFHIFLLKSGQGRRNRTFDGPFRAAHDTISTFPDSWSGRVDSNHRSLSSKLSGIDLSPTP